LSVAGMLNSTFLHVSVDDSWRWHLDPDKGYSISGVYHMLTRMKSIVQEVPNNIISNKW